MPLSTSPTPSSWSSAPLFKEDKYSSTLEEETEADTEVTFIHSRNQPNSTFANNPMTERPMSTPTMVDYTTQGDPDASPSTSYLFRSTATGDKFLEMNNFFIPDGSNRHIHQMDNKVFLCRLPEKWQQCISLGATCSREDAEHTEVFDG